MAVAKEAIALVLDIGKSMHKEQDSPTVLEKAKQCINMIIQRKIFSESKDEIALILFGSVETSNNLSETFPSEYENIKIVQDFQPARWELLEFVNDVKGTDISTDFIDALVVATDVLYYKIVAEDISGRIICISNFGSNFSTHQLNKICNAIKKTEMELNIIGPVAYSTEDQKDNQTVSKAEKYICQILREVNGESYSFSEALPALIYYQKKKVQAIPWNANLDIGTNLNIPISAYTKVTESKPKPWKSAYAHKVNAKIEKGVSYLMNDELQTKVPKEDIIPAFKYGTTLVPYSEEDKNNMDYQSGEKGMKVLGFTKSENIQRYHYAGDKAMYVFGQKNRELAGVILAPFIHALHDTDMVAIVRYVYSTRSAPKIGFLSPKIKPYYECLVFVVLPFMEDLRHFIFTPFNSDPKKLPSEEQLGAVDDLITAMDLTSSTNKEDDGEMLKPKYTVNPYLQRLYQCLQYKAFHPEKPLPEIMPHIKAIVNSPELLERAEPSLKRIKSLFPLKEIVPKKAAEAENYVFPNGKSDEPVSKEEINEDFKNDFKFAALVSMTDKITKVGSVNPVRDFQFLLSSHTLPFSDICQQMMDVVFKFLQDGENLTLYHSKILSICKELRHASLEEGDPLKYNSFMTNLQNVLLECDEELWNKIKDEKIGLITKTEVSSSTVSSEQAEIFLSVSHSQENKDSVKVDSFDANEEDYDLLLDQL